MKIKAISTVTIISVVFAVVAYGIHQKKQYDELRDLTSKGMPIVRFSQHQIETLKEVEENWNLRIDETNGPIYESIRAVGIDPSFEGMLEALTFEMPEYSWTDLEKNIENASKGLVSVVLKSTKSIDGEYYLSKDSDILMIRPTEDAVLVMKKIENGIRELTYTKDENI